MIDTLRLKSPYLGEWRGNQISNLLVHRTGIDMATGVELYNLCSGSLEGSFESSVSVNVRRQELRRLPQLPGQPVDFTMVDCSPFIEVEGSVHKAMMGHNIFGGPERLQPAIAWLVADLERRFGFELPPWQDWYVLRCDIAECYNLGSFEAVEQYIHALGLARFPRRQPNKYGNETVMFSGTTTTWKAYHKGPEFRKHRREYVQWCYAQVSRIQGMGKFRTKEEAKSHIDELQLLANGYLRIETSIKNKKLQSMYGGEPTAGQLDLTHLEAIHDRETGRVLKEGQHDMETVRTTEEVRARLDEVYEPRLARILFGTWLQLAALGEDGVRRGMKRASYYSHRKQLADAGIVWDATDVYIREQSFIPAGFRPVRSDPRRVSGESLKVREALMPYACA